MVKIFATYYNQEERLPTLLASLKAQTSQNYKLTVCSNADKTIHKVFPLVDFEKIVTKENTGFWGCKNRVDFISTLDDNDYIINTSAEDYYAPTLIEEIEKGGEDFIYWDLVHHQADYTLLRSSPFITRIDWGNFCVKAKFIKNIVINTESYTADGEAVEEIMKMNPTMRKISKVLMIKN